MGGPQGDRQLEWELPSSKRINMLFSVRIYVVQETFKATPPSEPSTSHRPCQSPRPPLTALERSPAVLGSSLEIYILTSPGTSRVHINNPAASQMPLECEAPSTARIKPIDAGEIRPQVCLFEVLGSEIHIQKAVGSRAPGCHTGCTRVQRS